MTMKQIFEPSESAQEVVSSKFTRPNFAMSFMLDVPADLATAIYDEGTKFGLNKTKSLQAVFMAGAAEFTKAKFPTKTEKKTSGSKGKSGKSKAKETSTE